MFAELPRHGHGVAGRFLHRVGTPEPPGDGEVAANDRRRSLTAVVDDARVDQSRSHWHRERVLQPDEASSRRGYIAQEYRTYRLHAGYIHGEQVGNGVLDFNSSVH